MERLTMNNGICQMASTEFCLSQKDCYSCPHGRKCFKRLAAYEDTEREPEEIKAILERYHAFRSAISDETGQPMVSWTRAGEICRAEKDGRLVVLPCKDDTVFTIEEDFFNCDQCKHKAGARYHPSIGRISCDFDNNEHCPLSIKEHEAEGFEISFRGGTPVVSLPGAYGCEGLETYSGFDGKCYYTSEEAEAALKKREEADDAAD